LKTSGKNIRISGYPVENFAGYPDVKKHPVAITNEHVFAISGYPDI